MQIQKKISLKPLNTFGLEAKAKLFVEVSTIDELREALASDEARDNEIMILGGGSNILLTQDFDGLVIKNSINGKEVIHETEDFVLAKIGAGENWHEFVRYALDQEWGGIENLSLIPGTVGAAPMQNIGAYGVEIKEVFEYLEAVNIESGDIEKFNKDQCRFGYRESIFKNKAKGKYVIAYVVLKLTKREHQLNTSYGAIYQTLEEMKAKKPTIRDISDAVTKIRQSKLPDPAKIGNAGSFFKNPTIDKIQYEELKTEYPDIPGYELPDDNVKVPAAWLIEQCGWKGVQRGEIGVHKNQALVLVNYGGGKGSDLKALAEEIKDSVIKKFGIELNQEVNII
ncbi:UDP-N-acetylenolpyruvoylglucosamine reductase [Fulvivirga imtechensis AK7]|uniref:UDP-N-acetylenolpyruvoylglucosamine reductase n=1 Tax=Fulvivirga imtechensis AK7 TaxID=1237149 RepID=L8JTJ9_9BACT|nr:UDP-N-acetylmuramate dehydrogenase [Fulvivirga imtechensis]ELR71568.1 UDP-N-acetylenolpyruvoylglucosamine reductase [Fulvivirga imtechensis AK7]